jgi:hypothetical protein
MTISIHNWVKDSGTIETSFEDWVTEQGSTPRSLSIGEDIILVSGLELPSTIDIVTFTNNAMMIGSGLTLTINKMTATPRHQIFDSDLNVVFNDGAVGFIYPEWFGTTGNIIGSGSLYMTSSGGFNGPVVASDPTMNTHLTTKLYVDTASGALNTSKSNTTHNHGTGTSGYLPKYISSSGFGNSVISQSNGFIDINASYLTVQGSGMFTGPIYAATAPDSPNQLTNKDYVDTLVGAALQIQGNWDASGNIPDLSGVTTNGYFWIANVSGNTNLSGITNWALNDWAIKVSGGWAQITNQNTPWGTIQGTLSSQTDLQNALDNKASITYVNNTSGALNTTITEHTQLETTAHGGIVPTSGLINTTFPLIGGGDLSADRTISMGVSSTSTSGYLTHTDWNTFNNKATPTHNHGLGTSGYIPVYNNTSGFENSIIYDNSGYIGIGYTNSTNKLSVNGNIMIPQGSYFSASGYGSFGQRVIGTTSTGSTNIHGSGDIRLIPSGVSTKMILDGRGVLTLNNSSAGNATLTVNGGCHIGGISDPGDNNLAVDGSGSFGTTLLVNKDLYVTETGYFSKDINLSNELYVNGEGIVINRSGGASYIIIQNGSGVNAFTIQRNSTGTNNLTIHANDNSGQFINFRKTYNTIPALSVDLENSAIIVEGSGSFTGVVHGATPTVNTHLTTKLYVDTASGALNTSITSHTQLGTTAHSGIVPSSRTVSTTAPITGGGALSGNLTIAMSAASTNTSGYLTHTDWNTFNGKGTGTVTSASVTTTAGVSATVATATTTPAFSFNLGAITPTSVTVSGTAGAGIFDMIAQTSVAAPTAGYARLGAVTTSGFTRLQYGNEGGTSGVINRDNYFLARTTASALNKGDAVYISGNILGVPQVGRAMANSSTTTPAVGLAMDNISIGAYGQIMRYGILSNITSSGFASAESLFLSPTVAGGWTNTRPSGSTNVVQRLGVVIQSGVAGAGTVLVNVGVQVSNTETGTNSATWSGQAILGTSFNGNTIPTSTGSLSVVLYGTGAASTVNPSGYPTGTLYFQYV